MNRALYLVSSSANREYVADVLEVLGSPRGLVHHFRYRKQWVDDKLWNCLPKAAGQLPQDLRDLTVVVVYLFQEQSAGEWAPTGYVPVRCGRLVEGFQDGNVAHFYFAVTDYVMQANGGTAPRIISPSDMKFKVNETATARTSYAHVDRDLDLSASPEYGDTLAFQEFVDLGSRATQWRTRSLGITPLDVTYDVVFYRVVGIFHEEGRSLTEIPINPLQIQGYPSGEFALESGQVYYVKIATYLLVRVPALFPGQGTARMTLEYDASVFRPVGRTSFPISSPYDLEHLAIQAWAHETRRTVVSVTCKHEGSMDRDNFVRREVLVADIGLPVVIHPEKKS